jgi:hypothetical protein
MKRLRFVSLFAVVLLALSATGSQSFAQNMLVNPGFEALGGSYDGWFTFGGGPNISTAADDNIMRTGDAASKIYGEFAGCPGTGSFTVGGYGQLFTPVIGNTYEFGGYYFMSSADQIPGTNNCDFNRCVAKVVFFNAAVGGSEISGNEIVIGDYSTTPLDEWIEFSVSAIAPPGALRMETLVLFLQPACDTGSVFIDDTWLYEHAPVSEINILNNPSFDGGLTGWEVFGNAYLDTRSWAVRTPYGCAKLFSTFTPGSDSGIYQMFEIDPGSIWRMGTNSLTTCREDPIEGTNDNFITAKLTFLDVDTLELDSSEMVILDNTSPMGTWTHHELIGTAPAGAVFVRAYILFISPSLLGGAGWVDDITLAQIGTTGAEPMPGAQGFTLRQNVPNPFNPSTRIDFELEKAGQVDLSVYDVSGRLVANLFSGHLGEGAHEVTWNGKTNNGTTAATGVYLYVLKTETGMDSKRMVLLR